MMLVFIPGKSLMCLSSRIGISLWGLFRVISYKLMIAKERDTGDCQMGSLHFRGCFSKNFRETLAQKSYRSRSENGSRKTMN